MSAVLKRANDYRRIRKQCMPLFDLAAGKPVAQQLALYQTMVHQIADVLGVEATEHDLDPVVQMSVGEWLFAAATDRFGWGLS